ncbi:MAG: tRNA (adenosine(37)-N6)-threonylcarbamoyltransferase complex ATPase subunit type 1 TsaE [Desulfatirhabdiaceae bacterium]
MRFNDSQNGNIFRITTTSPDQTRRLGQILGSLATPGMVMALTGELGSGKTCLVQGLASGLDVPVTCDVVSPSYTLVNQYPGRLVLHHIDLYRITADDLDDIGLDEILAGDGVVAIEWAERLPPDFLGDHVVTVRMACLSADDREIAIEGRGKYKNIARQIAHNMPDE